MNTETKKNGKSILDGILLDANITGAISYFPFFIGPVLMFFFAKEKKNILKHIKYSVFIALIVVVLCFILNPFFQEIVNIGYWLISIFLAYKAYKGDTVTIEILDNVEERIAHTIKK